MKFTAKLHGHDITGDVVNPGEWWGKAWVVEIGVGYSSFFKAVEADNEQEAIDYLTDSEEHGKVLRMVDEDIPEDEKTRAGNAGEQIDLENVAIYGKALPDHRMNNTTIPFNSQDGCSDIMYVTDEGVSISPLEYADQN